MQLLKPKIKSALTVFGLTTLIAVAVLWFDEQRLDEKWLDKSKLDNQKQTEIGIAGSEQSLQADYFMENYNIISTDNDGQAYRWLSGGKLAHFPNGDTTLIQPTFQFSPLQQSQSEQHWLLSAETGMIHRDKKITLDGNVKIQQLSGKTKALNIQTKHLNISLAENTASTQSKVVVSDENGEINATGMNINFDEHRLRLLSNVKGHYAFE